MPQVGIRVGAKTYTWEEAHAAAEAGTIPYPPPLVAEMAQQRNSQMPTASTLGGCLRRFELQRTTDYYESGHKMLPAIFGTAFHALMDGHRQKVLKPGEHGESRWHAEIAIPSFETGGPLRDNHRVTLSGQVDFLREGDIISDWKTKKYIPQGFQPTQEHKAQVNVYNWLAAQNGLTPAKTGELVYVSQDWASTFRFPLRDTAFVGDWIRTRLAVWADAVARGKLPPPVEAFWQQDETTGKMAAPCVYCPVLEACRAALATESEVPFG